MRQRVAILLALLLFSSLAFAEVRHDRAAGISYDIPSWWDVEEREEGIVMSTEDESLVVMLWTPRGQSLSDAVDALDEELSNIIQGAKVDGQPQSGTLNGMETLSISGKGRIDGARAEYSVVIVDAKRPVIVMAFGETGRYEKHMNELKGFLKTIKRTKR
jgi:hypothetical protein